MEWVFHKIIVQPFFNGEKFIQNHFQILYINEDTLRRLKKGITRKQIINAFRLCKIAGIETVAHFIIGSPGEMVDDVKKNIDFAAELGTNYASFDILLRYPGTEAFSAERVLDDKTLEKLHDHAFKRFYLRPRLIARHIFSVNSIHQLKEKTRFTLELWKQLIKK